MAEMWGEAPSAVQARGQHYEEGLRLFHEGQHKEAIASFHYALNSPGCSPMTERLARYYQAEAYAALAETRLSQNADTVCDDETLENLRSAVELRPHYADLHCNLGCALLSRGEFVDALASLIQALEINPSYAKATHAAGIALYASNKWLEGLTTAQSALALDPTLRRVAYKEAERANTRGDREEALKALRRMADSEGGDPALFHARLARNLFRQERFKEAAEEYRQALAIRPRYADIRNQYGLTLVSLGQNEEALSEFRTALEINTRYLEARLNSGAALVRLGRRAEARTVFALALEQDNSNSIALEALSSLEEKIGGL